MLERVHHRLPVRILNRLTAAHASSLVRIEPDALKMRAMRRSGLSDFGDPYFEPALERLCTSVQDDARLNLFGRIACRQQITTALLSRLRMVQLLRQRPELRQQPLHQPLIVVGLPRSGTTWMHRLLCRARGTRALKLWELLEPLPPPRRDRRRRGTVKDLKMVKAAAPSLDAKHFTSADAAEECMLLLNPSMHSVAYWVMQPAYSYLAWLTEQEGTQPYQEYRQFLQFFQAAAPDQRLVLKAPAHAPHLAALTAAVPEARIVITHRDPVVVTASCNSLFHTLHSLVSTSIDHLRMGAANLDMLALSAQRMGEWLANAGEDAAVQFHYDQWVTRPLQTVEAIHEAFGLPFDRADRQCVERLIADRPQHSFGPHPYRLQDFGLEEAAVRQRFQNIMPAASGRRP